MNDAWYDGTNITDLWTKQKILYITVKNVLIIFKKRKPLFAKMANKKSILQKTLSLILQVSK